MPPEVPTPLGNAPVVPVTLIAAGGYCLWFMVHYWRDQQQRYPSDPLKSFLTGKGLPAPQRAQKVEEALNDLTPTGGGAAPATPGTQPSGLPSTAAGWDTVRCSSFWDPGQPTASGRAMDATTIASPYLPLGTQVQVQYKGNTVSGTVWDMGPADWVMASDPLRFLDLASPLMQQLTGSADDLITAQYRVTAYGTGRIYRPDHPMTAKLRQRWAGGASV